MRDLYQDPKLSSALPEIIAAEPVFQFKRSERKYILDAAAAEILKGQIGFYIPGDERAGASPNISSIYYDNADWKCYREHKEKKNPRFKIRFRRYDSNLNFSGSGFMEIKKKADSLTIKNRFKASPDILEAGWDYPVPDNIVMLNRKLGAEKLNDIYFDIARSVNEYDLRPVVKVTYFREAFENSDRKLRITFDSNLEFEHIENRFAAPSNSILRMPREMVIMEIKYAGSIPIWLKSSLRSQNLKKKRFSKYITAIDNIYEPDSHTAITENKIFKKKSRPIYYGNFESSQFNTAQL